jgi:hypothetical protein
MVPKWSKNCPKNDPKIDIFGNSETSILAAIYNTSSTLAPPRSLPKLMRKSDIIKIGLQDVNIHKIDSFFSRIWSKMASKSDVDPNMPPKDARGPQAGPPRPNMTQKWSRNDPKLHKN